MRLSYFGIFLAPFGTGPFDSSFFFSSGPLGTATGSGSLRSINSANNGALHPDTVYTINISLSLTKVRYIVHHS